MTTGRHAQLPNLLTMIRGLMAVMFFIAVSNYHSPNQGVFWLWIATGLFIVAAITDFLDGYLARRWQVVSAFGRVMDPFCDKLLVIGAFVMMSGARFEVPEWTQSGHWITNATGVMPWMVVIMLGRELFVTSARGVAESAGIAFGASWTGKAKMVLQATVIPIVLGLIAVAPPAMHEWSAWAIQTLIWITVLVTVLSGIPYAMAIPQLMRQKDPV
ncbi:MAG: CDP-alcohol phosphatidyltransferase family protein [Phycisphaerales bacterium]|nr:CDP-alcohol phosphatidyltransferase family protein [Phycisphaerales bacterium]